MGRVATGAEATSNAARRDITSLPRKSALTTPRPGRRRRSKNDFGYYHLFQVFRFCPSV
jgi:hypothetical protein